MDDPSNRGPSAPPHPGAIVPVAQPYPPAPYAPAPYPPAPYAPAPYGAQVHVQAAPMVPSLPGMPPIPMPTSQGVSVTIQNVVAPAPAIAPYAVAAPPAPLAPQQRGVVDLMREDAAHRAMEAVSKRGPARVLGYVAGSTALAAAVFLALLVPFGASASAVALASVPLVAVAIAAFVLGARAGRGVASHHLEQAILRVAGENGGVVRVVQLAQATGRPLRECQVAVDAMVSAGHATVEADDTGALLYRVPDLEPKRRIGPATEVMSPPFGRGA